MTEPVLKVQSLRKEFGGLVAVKDVSFEVGEGEFVGLIGPNGCGKSNIVESLRWCMGETSAKSMRGSGMEDVIFSGTSNKPSKNIAEVIVNLSNDGSLGSTIINPIPQMQLRATMKNQRVQILT